MSDRARALLTCVALYYPLEWLANSLLGCGPSLARLMLGAGRIADLRLTPLGVTLFVTTGGAERGPFGGGNTVGTTQMLAVVLIAAALLCFSSRGHRLLSGLGLAVLANSALVPALSPVFVEGRVSPTMVFGGVLLFALLCLGLRWMLTSQSGLGYWGRLGFLLGGFALLPVLVVVVLILSHTFFFRRHGFYFIVPGTLAALLVSLRSPRGARAAPQVGWRIATVGAVSSLLLGFASPIAGRSVDRMITRERVARSRAALASIPPVPPDAPYPKVFFQRGVNFTAEWPNPYASLGAQQMLARLPVYGVNAVALVPYGWYTHRSPPRVHIQEGEGWESDEGLTEMARLAHHLGIKVMLKPAIWDGFSQVYNSAQDRAQWFAQYRLFLEHYARLATQIHADVFVIGGEFTHLTEYDADWRKLIARARELYPGPLVYAANFGDEFEHVSFWDALDYIGLQEYYPLPDNLSTDAVVAKVEVVEQKYHKPVLFTEAGFPSLQDANHAPWDDSAHLASSPALQAQCYDAIFKAFYEMPWFEGMYWWKIETNGSGGPEDDSHSPWDKPAIQVVRRWYLGGGR